MTLIVMALQATPARAEYRMIPSLTLGEEYNDNIYLRTTDRFSDYITHVAPSLAFTYKASLWDWDGFAAYDYYDYARVTITENNAPRAHITNLTRVASGVLFLALTENYQKISQELQRDYTQLSSFVNQTEQNIFSVNPYATLHPSIRTSVDAGYLYRNTWYKDPRSIDKIDHITYTEMKHEVSPTISSTAAAHYTLNRNTVQNYDKIDVSAGLKYEYTGSSNIYGTIGNAWLSAESVGRETQIFWNAGLVHNLLKLTFTIETVSSYVEDPLRVLRRVDRYAAGIKREVERTSLGLTGALQEYRNAKTKQLEQTSYTASGSVSHEITTQSKAFLDLYTQRLEENLLDTYTVLYLAAVRYEYTGWETLTVAVAYRYSNNRNPYHPDLGPYYDGNYYNNRFIVEIKKVF